MKIFNQVINFLTITEEDKEILRNEIKDENTHRVFYLSLFIIPVSLLHIIFFGLSLKNSLGIEYTWRLGIIWSHLFIILSISVIGFLMYWNSIRNKKNDRIAILYVQLLLILLLIGGAAIASIDQLVTTAINPFIITSIVGATALIIRPFVSLVFYLGSFILFYFLMSITQTNPDILISNRVNGITISALGMCMSFIFWRGYLLRFKQQRLIKKQQEELLDNYNKLIYYSEELKESNATKDKLFSVIAHDFRSPLSAILGVTQFLNEDFEVMSQTEIRNTLQVLNRDTELSFELLNNLLDWARTQQKKLNPKPELINLNQFTANTITQIKNISTPKNIEIVNNIPENISTFSDQSMLRSILKNLLTNGIKFTPARGKIYVDAKKNGSMVEVTVRDTGIGMTPDQTQGLFKKDNPITSLGTENEKGTGLGLQICKEFIELNGGKIWVESVFGNGSSFHFSLPAEYYFGQHAANPKTSL